LVVQCGRDVNSQELYSLAHGELRQLTMSDGPTKVNTFSVHGDAVAISRDSARAWRLRAELAKLGPGPIRGTNFGLGQQVALRNAKTMAFTRLDEDPSGRLRDAIYVKRRGSKARRIAAFANVWQQRYVRGRLTAMVGEKRRFSLARNVGTSAERIDRLRTHQAVRVAISRTGRAAYPNGRQGALTRVHVMAPSGRHVRTLNTRWSPVAWSPGDRSVLVTFPGWPGHIGLLDPVTGNVHDVGSLPCGALSFAQWRGG
jgi:hypothetical protein